MTEQFEISKRLAEGNPIERLVSRHAAAIGETKCEL